LPTRELFSNRHERASSTAATSVSSNLEAERKQGSPEFQKNLTAHLALESTVHSGTMLEDPQNECLPNSGTSGTVNICLSASMLKGSVGSFRDAQVDFEERQIVVHVLDCGGKAWTFQSLQLPGPIVVDKSRFMLDKTGKDLIITVKKANAGELWTHQQLTLRQTGKPKSSSRSSRNTRSTCSSLQHAHITSADSPVSSHLKVNKTSTHGSTAPADWATFSKTVSTKKKDADRRLGSALV